MKILSMLRGMPPLYLKLDLKMKLTVYLFIISLFQVQASSYAQNTKITLHLENVSVEKVLREIESNTQFKFLYNDNEIEYAKKVSINVKNKRISKILEELFSKTPITYEVFKKQIILKRSLPRVDEDRPKKNTKTNNYQQMVSGSVKDIDGNPLPGVNVLVDGTTNGTQTDFDGNYSIEADEGDILVFSYMGMITQRIEVTTDVVEVTMKENTSELDEVIVVGYGVQKKENLTGAVGETSSVVLENRAVQNAGQALQGTVANLNVTTNPGSPGRIGQGSAFQIRGLGDINGGAAPLVLIDGVQGDLNLLNPIDIESISVLKDAASAAIYGARATFGVILVTTKKGSRKQTTVSINSSVSNNAQTVFPKTVNSLLYAETVNAAAANSGMNPIFGPDQMDRIRQYLSDPGSIPTTVPEPGDPSRWSYGLGNANVDYFDAYYSDSMVSQKHDFAVSGGGDNTDYRISLGYLDQDGIYEIGQDNYKRYNLLANINTDLNEKLKFSFQTLYNRGFTNEPYDYSAQTGDLFHITYTRQPHWPLYDPNGYPLWTSEIQYFEGSRRKIREDELKLMGTVVFEPIKDWKTTARYSYSKLMTEVNAHQAVLQAHDTDGNPYDIQSVNSVSKTNASRDYESLELFSSYDKTIGGHYFNVLLGGQREDYTRNAISGYVPNLVTDAIPSLNTGTGIRQTSDSIDEWVNIGFFGRVNYNYKGKYLFEANARYDGTSKFPVGNQWGFFPSVSAGWNIAKENFFKVEEINSLKLRASYGELGNQQISNYLFYAQVPIRTNLGYIIDGERPNYISAPGLVSNNLTWATANTLDFGLDVTMLKNRLSLSFDWFERKTLDMVGPAEALPSILGVGVPVTNNADMVTKGFELTLGWNDVINEEFNYSLQFNLSDNFSKITKYNSTTNNIWGFYPGKEIGEIWGYTTAGIIQSDEQLNNMADQTTYIYGGNWNLGDIEYTDLNGDGVISQGENTIEDPGDLRRIGNTTPRYAFGFTTRFDWKGFDFNMFWQGIAKREVSLGDIPFYGLTGSWTQQVFETTLDYWTPENTDAYFARPYATGEIRKNQQQQTRFLQDASYMRLKNLQLGYSLPSTVLDPLGFSRLRVYVSGENLLTFSPIDENFDPERLHGYYGPGKSYPLFRTITMGVNIEF